AGPADAGIEPGRPGRAHERGCLRFRHGFELQLAALAGRNAGARRDGFADPPPPDHRGPGARRVRPGLTTEDAELPSRPSSLVLVLVFLIEGTCSPRRKRLPPLAGSPSPA